MRRLARIALCVALFALLPLGSARAGAGGGSQAPTEPFWLGPYFAGLRLTYTGPTGTGFVYGDCEQPAGEGGCAPPVQIQNSSSCERNPLALDRVPFRVFPLRDGAVAIEYEQSGVDVGTGGQTVTVYAESVLMSAALRDLRHRSESAPQPLAPPVYPPAALGELKRVTVAKKRFGRIGAIARAIHLPPAEVEVRLQIAELLPPGTLADVPAPTISTATLERLRQLAFRTQFHISRSARERGISEAALRRKIAPVRGLTGYCWPLKGGQPLRSDRLSG